MTRGAEFSDRTALAPNLAKILLAAERKGGTISVRDAQLAFSQKFRPSAQMMRSWFSELAILGYGKIEKSKGGKTWIFENTSRSVDQLDQLLSNPMPASIAATDLPSISCDQLDQLQASTDPTDRQLIHEVITFKPLQGEELRATDPTDLLIDHFSEKIENQNVTDCVKFIRTAISNNDPQVANCKTAPKLKIKFRSRFKNKFLLALIFI